MLADVPVWRHDNFSRKIDRNYASRASEFEDAARRWLKIAYMSMKTSSKAQVDNGVIKGPSFESGSLSRQSSRRFCMPVIKVRAVYSNRSPLKEALQWLNSRIMAGDLECTCQDLPIFISYARLNHILVDAFYLVA